MLEKMIRFRCMAARYKYLFAVMGIFMSGILLGIGYTSWHYDASLARQQVAYERQIARLESDLILERDVNRGRIEDVATNIDSIMDAVGRLMAIAQSATKTAKSAATTAKKAAATANSAANNAAQANITLTEIKPEKQEFPEQIEP